MIRKIVTGLAAGAVLAVAVFWGGSTRPVLREGPPAKTEQAMVAYIYQGDVWVEGLDGGPARRLTQDADNTRLAWSPSGRWVLVEKGATAYVLDVATGDPHRVSADSAGLAAQWAPHQDRLAFADSQGRLLLVNADGSEQQQVAGPPAGEPAGTPRWSADGKWLAFAAAVKGTDVNSGGAGLWRVPVADGTPDLLYTQPSGSGQNAGERPCVIPAAWTADGSAVLAWAGPMCTASIMADGLDLLWVPVAGTPGSPRHLGFTLVHDEFIAASPAGPVAAVLGAGRMTWTRKRLAIFTAQGPGASFISPEGVAAIDPTWSPGGWQLAYVAQPDLGEASGDKIRAGLMERRILLATPDGAPGGGVPPRKLTGDPRYRDESPRWISENEMVFARLDSEGKASLWRLNISSPEPHAIAEIDPPPLGGFGYYGWIDWGRLFDVWRPVK